MNSVNFPFLVSKDYAYSQSLPVKISTMLHPTSGSNNKDFTFNTYNNFKDHKKTTEEKEKNSRERSKYMHNAANPYLPFKDNLPVCFLPEDDVITKAETASMLYSNSELLTTTMQVPLKSGIPVKNYNDDGDNNTKCFKTC